MSGEGDLVKGEEDSKIKRAGFALKVLFFSLRRVLVGHRAAVNVVDFDDKYIVSASGDRTIKVELFSHPPPSPPPPTHSPPNFLLFVLTGFQCVRYR
jgi:hypothetical protein